MTSVLIHVAAVIALLPCFVSWQSIIAMFVTFWLTSLGVTLGYHRLLAHRSFRAPVIVERLLVFLGTWACQGGPLGWVTIHRQHHRYSDLLADPHDSKRGFWWSHTEWFLHDIPALRNQSYYTSDLQQDAYCRWLDRYFLLPQLGVGVILYFLADAWSIHGGGIGVILWVFAVRLTLVYNITKLVNSVAHKWGYRNFDLADNSVNCGWLACISFGEGWHNNHHAFPSSAKFAMRRGEVDIGWLHLRLLAMFGMVDRLQVPASRVSERLVA